VPDQRHTIHQSPNGRPSSCTSLSESSIPQVTYELGIADESLRRSITRQEVDEGLTTGERQELSSLRREVRLLKQAREFLKEAGEAFGSSSSRRRRGLGERLPHAHRGGVNELFYPTIGWWRTWVTSANQLACSFSTG
jgi:transposase-like protein